MATVLFVSKQSLVLLHREKERTKKLLKFLRDFQDTRDKKKEFATNNVQHKVHCCRLQAVYSPITVKNFVTVYTALNRCN